MLNSASPTETNSLSCSLTAVRVTRVARIRSLSVRGALPTNSLIMRSPAALTMTSGVITTLPLRFLIFLYRSWLHSSEAVCSLRLPHIPLYDNLLLSARKPTLERGMGRMKDKG